MQRPQLGLRHPTSNTTSTTKLREGTVFSPVRLSVFSVHVGGGGVHMRPLPMMDHTWRPTVHGDHYVRGLVSGLGVTWGFIVNTVIVT